MTFSFHYLPRRFGHADCLSTLPGLIIYIAYVPTDPFYYPGYRFQLQEAP
jgi:hypothetical protein